ncbi:MAG: glycosyltransferase family 39 protein [Anaerolineae bacterium]
MRSVWVKWTVVVLLLIALIARIYQIDSLSNQFHTVRQLYTAQMVRGQYFNSLSNIEEWRREIAFLNQPAMLEPPVVQTIALLGDYLLGHENLWIPRTLSAVMWVIGGYFLFLTAKKLMRDEAALVALAFYLFTSFGIEASRSFQANPSMVATIVMSWYAILNYFEKPSRWRSIAAGVIAGISILILIYAVFMIFPFAIWMASRKYGLRRIFIRQDTWIFGVLALLPAGIYYFIGFFVAGFLRNQTGALFNARLWLSLDYWVDWLGRSGIVVGFLPLILSIQALITTRKSLQADTLRSLWLGYFLYGFIINWPISSHDYYSLPIIPIVALSIASTIDYVIVRLPAPIKRPYIAIAVLLLIGVISIGGLAYYLPKTIVTSDEIQAVKTSEEIGAMLNHSPNVIFLTDDYGSRLRYYGEISGYGWPDRWSAYADAVAGRPQLSADKYFEHIDAGSTYRYFVITAFDELELQPDLQAFLETNFPVLAHSDNYLIYDLQASRTG